MRKPIKHLAYWTVPHGIQNLITHYLSRRVTSEEQKTLTQNERFRQRHSGKRCFILATGPSIKTQNLLPLQNEICIAVSNFFVHPDFDTIKPLYYCIPGYHLPITEDGFQNWITELAKNSGNSTLFFSLADKQLIQQNRYFSAKPVYFLKFHSLPGMKDINLTRPVLGPQSVPIMALQLAIYMGFSKIYLLGCDHDWLLHLGKSSHFYDEKQHALVKKGYNEWSGTNYLAEFKSYVALWEQYQIINQIAANQSTQIYNATQGGLLDVFPRVSFDDLF
jgi:hypothetical protein